MLGIPKTQKTWVLQSFFDFLKIFSSQNFEFFFQKMKKNQFFIKQNCFCGSACIVFLFQNCSKVSNESFGTPFFHFQQFEGKPYQFVDLNLFLPKCQNKTQNNTRAFCIGHYSFLIFEKKKFVFLKDKLRWEPAFARHPKNSKNVGFTKFF